MHGRSGRQAVQLGPVQETLLLPLYARAAESRAAAPLLRDPHAVATVERLAYDFSRFRDPSRVQALVLRAAIIDEIARQLLQQYPSCTLVEIGAGLNARFERLDNGRVRWFDLDLPDVAALRKQFFLETSRRTLVAASVLDPEWLAVVASNGAPPFVMIAEGVLPYFPEGEVQSLFSRVAARLEPAAFLFDTVASHVLLLRAAARGLKARLAWTCDEPRDIERWDPGYRLMESWSMSRLPRALERRLPASYRTVRALTRVLDPDDRTAFRVNLLCLRAPQVSGLSI